MYQSVNFPDRIASYHNRESGRHQGLVELVTGTGHKNGRYPKSLPEVGMLAVLAAHRVAHAREVAVDLPASSPTVVVGSCRAVTHVKL